MSTPNLLVALAILKGHRPGLTQTCGLLVPDDPQPPEDLRIYHTDTPGFTTPRELAECADQQGGFTVFIDGTMLYVAAENAEHVQHGETRVLTKAQPNFIPRNKEFS